MGFNSTPARAVSSEDGCTKRYNFMVVSKTILRKRLCTVGDNALASEALLFFNNLRDCCWYGWWYSIHHRGVARDNDGRTRTPRIVVRSCCCSDHTHSGQRRDSKMKKLHGCLSLVCCVDGFDLRELQLYCLLPVILWYDDYYLLVYLL